MGDAIHMSSALVSLFVSGTISSQTWFQRQKTYASELPPVQYSSGSAA